MAFILNTDPTILRIKLTNKGRELLSRGNLTFSKFGIGDSEIDYTFDNTIGFDIFNETILRPKDQNPKIVSFLEETVSGNTLINLPTVVSNTSIITNSAIERGFFQFTSGITSYYTLHSNVSYVKQTGATIYISGVTGGSNLLINKLSSAIITAEPVIGDYILVKWANPLITGGTLNVSIKEPVPYIWYKIEDIISGSLTGNDLIVQVDKLLPNFNTKGGNIKCLVYIYPNSNNRNVSGDSIQTYYGSPFVTDFVTESVLAFFNNYDIPTIDVPVWNMSIVFTEDVAGVKTTDYNYSQYYTKDLGGFIRYIQQIDPHINKIGIIHYSNNSPSNNYGEGLANTTPILVLPTIMWHKSSTKTIGLTLTCDSTEKTVSGLTTVYHDLIDSSGNIVGKVFNDLQIFVIEDQELLFAMSYKANRNWTLPEFTAGINISLCPQSDIEITEVDVI